MHFQVFSTPFLTLLNFLTFSLTLTQENGSHSKMKVGKAIDLPELCDFYESTLSCKHIKSIKFVLDNMTNRITTLEIRDSSLPFLNLSSFHKFPTLRSLSIENSELSHIVGEIPKNLTFLSFAANSLTSDSLREAFAGNEGKIESVNLSENFQEPSILPESLFQQKRLKNLYLAGNKLEGFFVWGTMWEWLNGSFDILRDADQAFCSFTQPPKNFSLLGCLMAKSEFERTCASISPSVCSSCVLYGLQKDLEEDFPAYPIAHRGSQGSTSISLILDCSNQGLLYIPKHLPLQTWTLNVSNNKIKNLSPLVNTPYVMYLDATNNAVDIETLMGSPFLHNFMSLSLQNNRISHLPPRFLEAVRTVQNGIKGTGELFLGSNHLHCDCRTATETKRLLSSMKIPDWKEIYCRNFEVGEGGEGAPLLPLKDLKLLDVCVIPTTEPNPDQEVWIYILIFGECLLIFGIVLKVYYDRRRYRATGKLPFFSHRMPRLPCDAMLESEDKGQGRRASGSAGSSCAYVGGGGGGAPMHNTSNSQISVHRSNSWRSQSTSAFLRPPHSVAFNLKGSSVSSLGCSEDEGSRGFDGAGGGSSLLGDNDELFL